MGEVSSAGSVWGSTLQPEGAISACDFLPQSEDTKVGLQLVDLRLCNTVNAMAGEALEAAGEGGTQKD